MTAAPVALGPVTLTSPVLNAAGCLRVSRDLEDLVDLTALGAVVSPTLTLTAVPAAPGPRIVETPSGLVHPTVLDGPGLHGYLATDAPRLVGRGRRLVLSLAAGSLGDLAELARHAGAAPGVVAVELRLSPPGARGLGLLPVTEGYHAARAVAAVRSELPPGVALLAKLPAAPDRVVDLARACGEAGADAVTLVDAAPAYAVDPGTGGPWGDLDPAAWGLSGPALAPVALRCLAEVRRALPTLPVVACGGILTVEDARSRLAAGATCVQIGTGLLHDPTVVTRLAAALQEGSP